MECKPAFVRLLRSPRLSSRSCWLTALPFYLSFLLPIALYILINSALFAVVAHSLLCGKTGQQLRSTQAAESQRLSRFSVALSCFVVLGLTWSFGLFAIGPMRVLFQILFCTFASLTGFFIFLLYIVTSRAKRACWNSKSTSLTRRSYPCLSRYVQIARHPLDLLAHTVHVVRHSRHEGIFHLVEQRSIETSVTPRSLSSLSTAALHRCLHAIVTSSTRSPAVPSRRR